MGCPPSQCRAAKTTSWAVRRGSTARSKASKGAGSSIIARHRPSAWELNLGEVEYRSRPVPPVRGLHKSPRLTARWTASFTHASYACRAASLLSMLCEGAITGSHKQRRPTPPTQIHRPRCLRISIILQPSRTWDSYGSWSTMIRSPTAGKRMGA